MQIELVHLLTNNPLQDILSLQALILYDRRVGRKMLLHALVPRLNIKQRLQLTMSLSGLNNYFQELKYGSIQQMML